MTEQKVGFYANFTPITDIKKDIEDRIRWETIEIEWMEWDAPWEMEEEELFNPEEYILLMKLLLE